MSAPPPGSSLYGREQEFELMVGMLGVGVKAAALVLRGDAAGTCYFADPEPGLRLQVVEAAESLSTIDADGAWSASWRLPRRSNVAAS